MVQHCTIDSFAERKHQPLTSFALVDDRVVMIAQLLN